MIGKIQFQFVHQIGRKRVIKKIIYIFTLVSLKKHNGADMTRYGWDFIYTSPLRSAC